MFESVRLNLVTLFSNPVFLSSVFSWFCAQFIKTIIDLIGGKIHSVKALIEVLVWRTGGLPSSHTATVTALCTSVAIRSGITSDLFCFAFCFLMVTVRDALGVRRASGLQAKKINEVGHELDEKGIISFKPLKEVHGHSPMEVALGAVLGFFIGLGFTVL